MVELVDEVAISGCTRCGNHGYALWHSRPLQLAVHFKNPFLFQTLKNLAAATHEVAHSVVGVYGGDYQ
jgi:hypothetical protein